jgi:hypothetical protein
MIDSLEARTMLSTYVITGTEGPDNWTVAVAPGAVLVNSLQFNNPNITDVQFNGLGGNDTLTLTHASIPVAFNSGLGETRSRWGLPHWRRRPSPRTAFFEAPAGCWESPTT